MKKYKVKRIIEFEVEAENEEEARCKSAEKDDGDWSEAEVVEKDTKKDTETLKEEAERIKSETAYEEKD